jgi:hypothetical protein
MIELEPLLELNVGRESIKHPRADLRTEREYSVWPEWGTNDTFHTEFFHPKPRLSAVLSA